MIPRKPADTDFPIHELLATRWSPRAMSATPMDEQTIHSLFEAARWAPSSSNIQPWRYVYATKDDHDARIALESLLVDGNYWAKEAYLLLISFYDTKRERSTGELIDNPYGLHDTGAANLSIALQATALGLDSHQMGGFDHERANEVLGVPGRYKPASMMAIGLPAESDAHLNEQHRQAEQVPRMRKNQSEFVFHTTWRNS